MNENMSTTATSTLDAEVTAVEIGPAAYVRASVGGMELHATPSEARQLAKDLVKAAKEAGVQNAAKFVPLAKAESVETLGEGFFFAEKHGIDLDDLCVAMFGE